MSASSHSKKPLPFKGPVTRFERYPHIVTFRIDDTVFTVSRKPFLYPGSFFERHLKPPSRFGLSKANPIIVPSGVPLDDFRHFVRVMQDNESNKDPPLTTLDEWRGVLHLATKWDFPVIRRQAIKELAPMVLKSSITDQLYWVKNYQIKTWFFIVYSFILVRPNDIPRDDLRKASIGWATICKLYMIRETWLAHAAAELGIMMAGGSVGSASTPGSDFGSGSGSGSGSGTSEAGEETDSEMDTESEAGGGGEGSDQGSSGSQQYNSAAWFGMPLSWARSQLEIVFSDELLCMRND